MGVVRIESTFTDRDRTSADGLPNGTGITVVVPRAGVVWMDAGGEVDEVGMSRRDCLRAKGCGGRLAYTDKGPRSCCAGPLDHRVRFVSERGIGQMDVAIREDRHGG